MADYSLLRILVVDDNETDRLIREAMLLQIGCSPNNIVVVSSAQAALDHLENNIVDIMFTDLQMPEMDGKQLIRQVYGDDITKHVRVVMVTTEDEPDLQIFLKQHRAKYLQKRGLTTDHLQRVMKEFYPDGAVG